MSNDPTSDIADLVDVQIKQQGTACVAVDGGHVFVFTLATLEAMVEKAREHGKTIVFVQDGAAS